MSVCEWVRETGFVAHDAFGTQGQKWAHYVTACHKTFPSVVGVQYCPQCGKKARRDTDTFDTFFMVADWHALTTDVGHARLMRERTFDMVADWLAAAAGWDFCWLLGLDMTTRLSRRCVAAMARARRSEA